MMRMRHDTMIGSICCELASQARASACTGLATAKDNVVGYSSKSVRIPNGHHLPGNMQTSGVPKSTEQLERRALPWAPLFFFAHLFWRWAGQLGPKFHAGLSLQEGERWWGHWLRETARCSNVAPQTHQKKRWPSNIDGRGCMIVWDSDDDPISRSPWRPLP